MGLLDGIAGQSLGSILGGGQQQNLVNGVLDLLTSSQSGGLSGLVQQFSSKGLGDIVNSWIGTGQNLPITPEQIQQGLGSNTITQLAQQVGVQPNQVSSMLAQHLPGVIDKLTPKGQIPQGDITSSAMNLLGGLFK
jgi:uncharacterized protein YidB (DUF937 family)